MLRLTSYSKCHPFSLEKASLQEKNYNFTALSWKFNFPLPEESQQQESGATQHIHSLLMLVDFLQKLS